MCSVPLEGVEVERFGQISMSFNPKNNKVSNTMRGEEQRDEGGER